MLIDMKNKKKILVFAVQFYPETSGYSFATTNFIKSIRENYDVTVYTPVEKNTTIPELPGIDIHRDSKKGLRKYFYQFKTLFPLLRQLNQWDVIFFDTAEMFILGNIITKLAPQKTIVRFHGCMTTEAAFFSSSPMMKVWKFFIRKWVKKAAFIAVTTPFYIDFINRFYLKSNLYLTAAKKYHVVPNTIFTEDYDLLDKKTVFDRFNINSKKFTLLTLGRMDKDGLLQKGIEDLLFALHRLKTRFGKTNFSIAVIGDGDKKFLLKQQVKKLKLEEEVIFISQADHIEVLSLSKHVNATVLFSRFEGMSMFALESISMGCFPVFSKTGGLMDLIEDGKSGFLVEPQNIMELAATLEKVMNMTEKEIQNLREQSREHFRKNFTPQQIAEKFSNLVDLIL